MKKIIVLLFAFAFCVTAVAQTINPLLAENPHYRIHRFVTRDLVKEFDGLIVKEEIPVCEKTGKESARTYIEVPDYYSEATVRRVINNYLEKYSDVKIYSWWQRLDRQVTTMTLVASKDTIIILMYKENDDEFSILAIDTLLQ